METQLRLVIYWRKSVYDDLLVSSRGVKKHVSRARLSRVDNDAETCENGSCDTFGELVVFTPSHLNNERIHSYAVSAYVHALKSSNFYRLCALRPLIDRWQRAAAAAKCPAILIKLRAPPKEFLDYKWGERMTQMALERCEVDHAMSWLSTLGGAFSALGEHFQHCAQMAGKISIHQFKLALRLGDPLLEARCKLYAALSIIQQGNLRIPKLMIQDIFKFAVEQKDAHLQRMCQGVWAKLKYCYKLRRQQKKMLKN